MNDEAGNVVEDTSSAADLGSQVDPGEPSLDVFLGEPTRHMPDWAWLWTGDHTFPNRSHRGGLLGRLLTLGKRLLRPFVKAPVADLWDRQRVFNLILLETLETRRAQTQQILTGQAELLAALDRRTADGLAEVMGHNDALFARVDQKLDRYRRESRELWHRLGAFIAAQDAASQEAASQDGVDAGGDTLDSVSTDSVSTDSVSTDSVSTDSASTGSPQPLSEVQRQQGYLDLEERYRGAESEIAERLSAYLPYLEGRGEILDLGCGRGESLQVFTAHGLPARGIDASAEMVARCREKGLTAEVADLFDHLEGVKEASLGAVVSYHVIEHLPATAVDRLVRLAWRALVPGGVLILETPSPLSLVMAARNFWIDPTHVRPVHPASLEVTFRAAGFEPVHRLDLHPFPDDEGLPEIDLSRLSESQRPLADEVNRLRDMLDDLLFGERDFAMVGEKPA